MAKKDAAAGEKRAVVHFLSGGPAQGTIKLRRDATIFGREKGDVILEDTEASSTHCQIQSINGVYHVFDMNSTNGTFVNNERIVKSKLAHNDVITIGQTSLRFSLEDESSVRHISTIFKSGQKTGVDGRSSLVDTLIESEHRQGRGRPQAMLLKVTYLDGKSEDIELDQKIVFIGRASSFGRFDQDPEISRKHLLIKLNDTGEVFIEDQGSTNGSFLNGKKITGMHLVRPKDVVKVGTSSMHIFAKASA